LPNAPAVALSQHGETAGTAAAAAGVRCSSASARWCPRSWAGSGNNALAMATVIAGGLLLAMLVLVLPGPAVAARQLERRQHRVFAH